MKRRVNFFWLHHPTQKIFSSVSLFWASKIQIQTGKGHLISSRKKKSMEIFHVALVAPLLEVLCNVSRCRARHVSTSDSSRQQLQFKFIFFWY